MLIKRNNFSKFFFKAVFSFSLIILSTSQCSASGTCTDLNIFSICSLESTIKLPVEEPKNNFIPQTFFESIASNSFKFVFEAPK